MERVLFKTDNSAHWKDGHFFEDFVYLEPDAGEFLVSRGIRAASGRGCFDVSIAEWNIAMMVNLARNLRQMIRNQDTQVWDRDARFQSEIRGLTVGLWGYGGIGRETRWQG